MTDVNVYIEINYLQFRLVNKNNKIKKEKKKNKITKKTIVALDIKTLATLTPMARLILQEILQFGQEKQTFRDMLGKFSITKTCLFKYTENSDFLHISAQNIDCGYSLELPRRSGSNESHNLCF